jgi:hypothetical protein
MWYLNVGTQIIFNLIFEIFAPHLFPILNLFYYTLKGFWDRGFTCNKKNSRQLI